MISLYWPASLDYYFYSQLLTLFSEQLWSGDLYPRWLTEANAGAGSPSFVFFPPVAYFLASILEPIAWLDTLGLGRLLLTIHITHLIAAAGAFIWLKSYFSHETARRGAMLYAFSPYCLCLTYVNYQMSALLAMALLPICFWAVDRICEQKRYFIVVLAVIYALIIGSHLLTALAAVPVLGAYVIWSCRKDWYAFALSAMGGLAAIGISAIYWLPAIANQHYLLDNGFTSAHFNYRTNFDHFYAAVLGPVLIGLPLVYLLLIRKKNQPETGGSKHRFFWLSMIAYSVFMASPLSLPIWNAIPQMANFQFPFRFLIVAAPAIVFLCCTYGQATEILRGFVPLASLVGVLMSLTQFSDVSAIDPMFWEQHILSHPSHSILRVFDSNLPYGHFDMEMQAIAIASGSLAILLLVSFLLYSHSRNQLHDQNLR